MSSKRVILLTKDRCLPSKSNQFYGNNASKGLNNNEQFNSISLNKNNKSENIKFVQSKSTPFSKKIQNNNGQKNENTAVSSFKVFFCKNKVNHYFQQNKIGFFDYKNDSKNALNDWKKNVTPNFHESLKTQEMKKEYKWKTKVKKDYNKSNLSLHIEDYENSVETKNVRFASKTSFDFLKQQNKKLMNPVIMQFKTSQKLLNSMHFTARLLSSDVRVRFAPSPTGKLHLGGLRTALFNFLFARKHGGSFILRIEDTDVERTIPGCAEKFEEILDGFGLRRDESPLVGGEYGPYIQTQRKDLYGEAAQRLIDSGHAYRCFCTSERLEILRKNAFRKQEIPRYDNRCRSLSKEESASRERDAQPYVIRFKFNREIVKFNDIVFGENIQTADEGDFIIIKSDGLPTYHFANVVDDQFMKISHVIRGAEWIPSCPKHIKLYESFKWTPPTFLHLPLITKDGHKKLSKRDNSAFVEYYTQEKGYLPLAILNYLLRNGSGLRDYKNDYCYSLEEMIKNFDENTIGTRDFMTDKNSLEKYGRLSFKQATPDYVMNAIVDHVSAKLPHVGEDLLTPEYIERVISFLTSNEETFSCLSDISSGDFHFFFGRPENGDKLLTKYDVVTCTRVLDNVISLPHLTPAGIKGVAAAMEIPAPDCFLIVRCALIDSFTGPPVGELFTFFSREECITRMNVVRQSLNVHQTQTIVLNG